MYWNTVCSEDIAGKIRPVWLATMLKNLSYSASAAELPLMVYEICQLVHLGV